MQYKYKLFKFNAACGCVVTTIAAPLHEKRKKRKYVTVYEYLNNHYYLFILTIRYLPPPPPFNPDQFCAARLQNQCINAITAKVVFY